MMFLSNKTTKIVSLLIAVVFLWIGIFGLSYHIDAMKTGIMVDGCLFNGQTEVCAMSFPEHIAVWQGMLTTLPREISLFGLLVLTVFFVATIFLRNSLLEFYECITTRLRLYIRLHSQISIFDYLKEAFSGGILNTKIYKSVII